MRSLPDCLGWRCADCRQPIRILHLPQTLNLPGTDDPSLLDLLASPQHRCLACNQLDDRWQSYAAALDYEEHEALYRSILQQAGVPAHATAIALPLSSSASSGEIDQTPTWHGPYIAPAGHEWTGIRFVVPTMGPLAGAKPVIPAGSAGAPGLWLREVAIVQHRQGNHAAFRVHVDGIEPPLSLTYHILPDGMDANDAAKLFRRINAADGVTKLLPVPDGRDLSYTKPELSAHYRDFQSRPNYRPTRKAFENYLCELRGINDASQFLTRHLRGHGWGTWANFLADHPVPADRA